MTQGNGLSDAYAATLTRLKAQPGNKSILGLKVLMWVLHSERPLRAKELCHALGVELGSTDLDHGNIPALRTLLASSLGLVTIEGSSSTVRLVHFTLQEHLLSDSTIFHSPHSTIAEVSLTYLNFRCVRDLSPALDSAPTTMPLLEYASFYWGEHARKEMTENVKILALRLLDKFDEHISAQLMSLHYNETSDDHFPFNTSKGPVGFTGLHGAAFLGIVEILAAVLEMKEWDVNAKDSLSFTPLIWAALRGHEGVVKALLEQKDINPDLADHECDQTPLTWAARQGHEAVVKMLLDQKSVNPNGAGTPWSNPPLFWAALFGHAGVIKILLEREDVNPNRELGLFCMTPLCIAVHCGHEGVVKMLLERNDIRTDIQDKQNHTLLSLALSRGHHKIAGMISERADTKSNTADPISQAPLPPPAQHMEERVAETQLRDDHPNTHTADPIRPPTSPSADSNTLERVPDPESPIPNSADSTIPSTEPPCPPQPLPLPPPELQYSPSQITTPPNTPPTLSIAANLHLITASFVCILAFFLYIFPFSSKDLFPFYR